MSTITIQCDGPEDVIGKAIDALSGRRISEGLDPVLSNSWLWDEIGPYPTDDLVRIWLPYLGADAGTSHLILACNTEGHVMGLEEMKGLVQSAGWKKTLCWNPSEETALGMQDYLPAAYIMATNFLTLCANAEVWTVPNAWAGAPGYQEQNSTNLIFNWTVIAATLQGVGDDGRILIAPILVRWNTAEGGNYLPYPQDAEKWWDVAALGDEDTLTRKEAEQLKLSSRALEAYSKRAGTLQVGKAAALTIETPIPGFDGSFETAGQAVESLAYSVKRLSRRRTFLAVQKVRVDLDTGCVSE